MTAAAHRLRVKAYRLLADAEELEMAAAEEREAAASRPALTLAGPSSLDWRGVAELLGVTCRKSISAAVRRGELPAPVRRRWRAKDVAAAAQRRAERAESRRAA